MKPIVKLTFTSLTIYVIFFFIPGLLESLVKLLYQRSEFAPWHAAVFPIPFIFTTCLINLAYFKTTTEKFIISQAIFYLLAIPLFFYFLILKLASGIGMMM